MLSRPEYKKGFDDRYSNGRRFELEVLEELRAAGYEAELEPDEFSHYDILLPDWFVECRSRTNKPFPQVWYPKAKMDWQQRQEKPTLIVHRFATPGYYVSWSTDYGSLKVAEKSPYTPNYEMPLDSMTYVGSLAEWLEETL